MLCHECQKENEDFNRYCVFCGVFLDHASGSNQGSNTDRSSQDTNAERALVPDLRQEVWDLRRQLNEIREKLLQHGIDVRTPTSVVPLSATDDQPQSHSFWQKLTRPLAGLQIDWELNLGGNWLARIGVLAVVIGMGFFLKLAFDNNWIGENGRVALGIIAGLLLLLGGEYFQTRYPTYGQTLVGGGIAILYLAVFAAFAIFGLIGLYPAVGLLLLISIMSAGLAMRYEAMPLAIIGVAGAFSAPFILGSFGVTTSNETINGSQAIPLLAHIIAVDVGVLALSTFRRWSWFTLLSLIGSLAGFVVWHESFVSAEYSNGQWTSPLIREVGVQTAQLLAQVGLTLIFLSFVGATTLFHLVWNRTPRAFDLSLMLINAVVFFGISYGLLWSEFRVWMGSFTILLAMFYGGIAYIAIARRKSNAYLSLMSLGIALIILTITVPVQLGGPWVSVLWATEAIVLIWLSFVLKIPGLRWAGFAAFVAFSIWLILIDTPAAISADLTPILNGYLFPYTIGLAAIYAAVFLLRRNRDAISVREQALSPALLVLGNVILTLSVPVQVDGAWIAVTWAIEATAMIWLSMRLGLVELRWFGLGVFVAIVVRLLLFDTGTHRSTDLLIINYRVLAFTAGVAALYVAAFFTRRYQDTTEPWEIRYALPGMLVLASFLSIWILSAELISAVDGRTVDITFRDAEFVKSLGLSLLWALYASVSLFVGIIGQWRKVRLGALVLLTVPILKLFTIDAVSLEQGYRVAAFLSLGGIALAGGLVYQRYTHKIKGFLFENGGESNHT